MSWHADEIILRATSNALAAVSKSQALLPLAYHVRSVTGHEWYRKEHEHSLPEEGLLVIRPVCGRSSHANESHRPPVLEWNTLESGADATALLSPAVDSELPTYLDGGSEPPASLRKALAALAAMLDQPVIYYACGMWAGEIDYEYCLSYSPDEALTVTGTEDPLRVGLAALGLHLPTRYFALHSRSFPWDAHKLT